MSIFTDIWRQLVRRRLWPVALLLLAAVAAVPMLLAKEPETTVTTTPQPPLAKSELADAPIVTASTASTREAGRRVLGKDHDIFKSTAKKPKVEQQKKTDTGSGDTSDSPPDTSGGSSPSGGSTTTPSPGPVAPTVPSTPAPKPRTYALYSLTVRFGSTDADLARKTLPKMQALPSEAQPLLIYLGLLDDRKTAVFLLDASAKAQGDGDCHPTPESCETIRLRAGETEFIDVVDAAGNTTSQFQLDLVKIHKSQTSSAAKSARSSKLARVSSVGGDVRIGVGSGALRSLGAAGRTR